jgi:hypothetical protein
MHAMNGTNNRSLTSPLCVEFAMSDGENIGRASVIRGDVEHFVVRVGPWDGFLDGDDVVLSMYGLDTVAIARTYDEEVDGGAICFQVPLSAFDTRVDGPYSLVLELCRDGHQVLSQVDNLSIKLSAPGQPPYQPGILRAPKALEPARMQGELTTGASIAHLLIPPYASMAPGDAIVVRWHDRFIALPLVSPLQVGLPLLAAIDVPLLGLEGLHDVSATWQVHDASGNGSSWAPDTLVPVPPTGADAPAPWLEGTVDDEGHVYPAYGTAIQRPCVRVEGHGARIDDRVTLYWDGLTASGKPESWSSVPRTVRRDAQTLDFDLPPALLRHVAGGSGLLHYTVNPSAFSPRYSLKRRVQVLGAPPPLVKPVVEQADGAVLDPQRAQGGASVTVPSWPGIAPDDECHLVWLGTTADGDVTYYGDVALGYEARERGGLCFHVPAHEVARLDRGVLRIGYRVKTFAELETPRGLRQECVHTMLSEWQELRVQLTQAMPSTVLDDLNGLAHRRIDQLKRPFMTFTPIRGEWSVRGGRDGIAPFHDGTFLCSSDDSVAMHVDFAEPCESVRFGYGASGPGGGGSILHVDICGELGHTLSQAVYLVPLSGLPGLWVHLQASDYGERIGSIVVHKDTTGMFRRVTAQLDNFTLTW